MAETILLESCRPSVLLFFKKPIYYSNLLLFFFPLSQARKNFSTERFGGSLAWFTRGGSEPRNE